MASFRKKVMAAATDQAQELVDAFVQGKTYYRGLGYAHHTPKGWAFVDLKAKSLAKPTVYISWLSAGEKGSGAGSATLEDLTKLADERSVFLELDVGVGPKRKGGTPLSRLRRFYARHGFVKRYGDNMVRAPK